MELEAITHIVMLAPERNPTITSSYPESVPSPWCHPSLMPRCRCNNSTSCARIKRYSWTLRDSNSNRFKLRRRRWCKTRTWTTVTNSSLCLQWVSSSHPTMISTSLNSRCNNNYSSTKASKCIRVTINNSNRLCFIKTKTIWTCSSKCLVTSLIKWVKKILNNSWPKWLISSKT